MPVVRRIGRQNGWQQSLSSVYNRRKESRFDEAKRATEGRSIGVLSSYQVLAQGMPLLQVALEPCWRGTGTTPEMLREVTLA